MRTELAEQLELYVQFLNEDAKRQGQRQVSVGYVVTEALRAVCRVDPGRRCIKPPASPAKLRNVALDGEIAQAIEEYRTKLGTEDERYLMEELHAFEEADYVIESLLLVFLRGDLDFQRRRRQRRRGPGTAPPARRAASGERAEPPVFRLVGRSAHEHAPAESSPLSSEIG